MNMDKKLEAMNAEGEEETNDAGQAIERPGSEMEAQKEAAENSQERSPEQEITDTTRALEDVDREIFAARRSMGEMDAKLASLREEMGAPESGGPSPVAEFQNQKIKQLEEKRAELNREKQEWIEQYGRENLPDGLVLEDEEGNLEAKGGSYKEGEDEDKRSGEEEKKEDLELREKLFKTWEEDAVRQFEKTMREDWRTEDAMNLDVTIQLMKLRVPKAMEEEAENFLDGKEDVPPFSTVWIKWQTSPLLDKLAGKPSFIGKLEITFDDEARKLAEEDELKKEEKEETKEKDGEPRDEQPSHPTGVR